MSRGRLGQHIHGAKILCFEIWDAVGLDNITDYTEPVPIMGTPVGYDTVTFEDIGAILRKYHIEDKLPRNVARYLLEYDPAQETPQTMTNDVDYYIVNTLPDSCQAALEAAEEMGIPAHVLTTYAEGGEPGLRHLYGLAGPCGGEERTTLPGALLPVLRRGDDHRHS